MDLAFFIIVSSILFLIFITAAQINYETINCSSIILLQSSCGKD